MRQIQVGGETYVSTDDVAEWIVLHNEDLAAMGGPWPKVADALRDLASTLIDWGRDPERSVNFEQGLQSLTE